MIAEDPPTAQAATRACCHCGSITLCDRLPTWKPRVRRHRECAP